MRAHERILARRLGLKITQEELARRVCLYGLEGFTPSHISKIENQHRAVKADELPAFATALECNITDLVEPQPEKRH